MTKKLNKYQKKLIIFKNLKNKYIIMDDIIIWSVYERDSLYYHKCKNLEICPNIDDNKCYCYSNTIVYPKIIGKCGFSCDNPI